MVSKLIQCGLKAQVFHSPGQRPGYKVFTDNAPCKGNFNITLFFTVALTGRVAALYPFTQGVALPFIHIFCSLKSLEFCIFVR